MKSIFKSIFALSAAVLFAASCNVDNIGTTYAHDDNTTGVTFVQPVLSDSEVSASVTSVTITVSRAVADAAQTVNIASTLPAGINVPSSVSFAAGQYATDLTLDLSSMEVGKTYKGNVSLANDADYNATAISSISITLAKAYTWAAYGKCSYTDDIVGPLFGAEPITYKVAVEKAEGFDVYRLIDPYGEAFPYNEPGDYRTGVKWLINATNPNAVTFDRTKLGVDWGYGEMEAAMQEPGTMVGKVITFPTKGLVVYDADGGYYANNNGAFKLDLNL